MKRIVVIGASSGIGERIARDFARVGCQVAVAARREEPLKALHDSYPDRVVYKAIDVTAVDAVERFLDLIEMNNGMDYLVYCAGVGFNDPLLVDAKTTSILRTNVLGMARITAAAYNYYKDTANVTPGHIAVITSVAGDRPLGVAAAYSASKAFQQRFLGALEQLARQQHVNVKITDVRPGFVDTPLLDGSRRYPMTMSVGHVAPLVEEAVLRGRRVAYIDSRWGVVAALWRLIPGPLWRRIGLDF